VALLHLQSHLRVGRVEVSGDAGEGGSSRSRMDPKSTGVTTWLGFIDLAPSSATTKEGTAPRVVVPPQPSQASTGRAPCDDTLWRRSRGSEDHQCDQIIKDGSASATIAGTRSLVGRSTWWLLSGGGKTATEETYHTAEKEHIRSRARVTPETRPAAAPPAWPHGPRRWQPGRHL
jgi:hypothetical protein